MNKLLDLTLEERLFLALITPQITPDEEDDTNRHIKDILSREKVNWNYLIKLALFHDVFPLLYNAVNRLNWLNTPREVISRFQKLWHSHLARIIILSSEFDHLMAQFFKKGIDVISLKGIYRARQLYPDEKLRSFNDLDFLVKLEELDSAKNLLKSQNYEPVPYIDTDHSPENSWNLQFYKRLPRGMRVSVDLHWGLARPRDYHIPLKQWWRNAREIQLKGERFRSFSIEDSLLYLIIDLHASKYIHLKQFLDLYQFLVLNQERMDWLYVEKSLKKIGLWSNFSFALFMVNRFFNHNGQFLRVTLPFERMKRIEMLKKFLGKKEIIRGTYSADLRQFFLILLLNDRFSQIVKSALRTLFPSSEAIAYRYSINPSSGMVYFLYILNPFFSIVRLLKRPQVKRRHRGTKAQRHKGWNSA